VLDTTHNMAPELDPHQVEELEEQVGEWSTSSTDCFNISVVRNDGKEHASFQPIFTYPIFGDEEAIFGYQDLSINLTFAAHDLRPKLYVTHSKVFEDETVKPTDVKAALLDFLPAEAFDATATDDSDAAGWAPPGERIREYTRDGAEYAIWCASLTDTAAKQVLENMQILVPLFIEGGTTLQLDQDWTTQRWKLFLLYQVNDKASEGNSPFAFVGFGTSYRVFTYPYRKEPTNEERQLLHIEDADRNKVLKASADDTVAAFQTDGVNSPLDLPSRERLSQFLILPSFQGGGHGQELYNAMYTTLTAPSNVCEFTVEDPNEAFDDLRDLCDLRHLRANNAAFVNLKINVEVPADRLQPSSPIPVDLIVSGKVTEKIRCQSKIDPRQFGRLVEMQTLSRIPPANRSRNRITKKERSTNELDKAYYFWRLYAKQRIYIHNRDPLMQLDLEERPEKVEGALDSVLEGYVSMLEKVEAREKGIETVGGASKRAAKKRKVIDEDDEDDGWEDEDDEEVVSNGVHKKVRIS
jgi:histone acetyltransferase 1